ncbi:MAG: CHAD domain-containing protein, partial [Verrucomicrobia bacterium]|nr:CHAD domain-containing protein [Verrucomicrobiota bacterium]
MSPKELHRRWRRRLVALEEAIAALFQKCRTLGGAETIHDLRVAIRRARLYAFLGRPLLQKEAVRRFDAWARKINGLLGPVRDCDVCLNWLAGCPDALDAIQLIHDERVRLWNTAFELLRRRRSDFPGVMKLRKHEENPAQKLEQRYGWELAQVAVDVLNEVAGADRMSPEQWHALRRRLRRWRYLRELSLSKRAHSTDAELRWLIRVQDALGESQNLEMARGLFERHAEWRESRRFRERARTEQARWI